LLIKNQLSELLGNNSEYLAITDMIVHRPQS